MRVHRVDPATGRLTLLAGTGSRGYGGDGGPATAALFDGVIRSVAADGTVSPYAEVDAPAGMDVAADGTVYVTSIRTRTVHRVDPASRAVTEVSLR